MNVAAYHFMRSRVMLDGNLQDVTLLLEEDHSGALHYDLWLDDTWVKSASNPLLDTSGAARKGKPDPALQKGVHDLNLILHDDIVNAGLEENGHTYHSDKRGSISTFHDGRHVIKLFGAANKSTLLHETGHFFFLEYERIVESGKAPEWMKRDHEALRQWSGMDKAKTEDEKRAAHEKVARGFEAYLRDGKAPIPELRPIFARFRAWLSAIYKSVKDLVTPTEEVKAVFDRMIVAEQEMAEVEAVNHLADWFEGLSEFSTEAEKKDYARKKEKARLSAEEKRVQQISQGVLPGHREEEGNPGGSPGRDRGYPRVRRHHGTGQGRWYGYRPARRVRRGGHPQAASFRFQEEGRRC